jgi:hypothetical protein
MHPALTVAYSAFGFIALRMVNESRLRRLRLRASGESPKVTFDSLKAGFYAIGYLVIVSCYLFYNVAISEESRVDVQGPYVFLSAQADGLIYLGIVRLLYNFMANRLTLDYFLQMKFLWSFWETVLCAYVITVPIMITISLETTSVTMLKYVHASHAIGCLVYGFMLGVLIRKRNNSGKYTPIALWYCCYRWQEIRKQEKKVYNMKLWEKTKRQLLEEKKKTKGEDSAGRSGTKIHPAKND